MKSLLSQCRSRSLVSRLSRNRHLSFATPNLDKTPSLQIARAASPTIEAIDPTHVPRAVGVKDGVWSKLDASLVELALKDNNKPVDKADGFVLLGKSAQELGTLAVKHKQPSFRGKQLLDGLLKGARSIEDIKVIPQAFKEALIKDGETTSRAPQ